MFRASIVTAGTSLLLALVALVSTSVTARGLGVEGRGVLASALLVAAIARGLALMGLGEAMVYQGRSGRLGARPARYLVAALVTVLIVGGVVALVGIPITPLPVISGIAVLTVVVAMTGSGTDLFVASARVQPDLIAFNWLRMFTPLLSTIGVVAVWSVGPLTVDLVLGILAAVGVAALVLGGLLLSPLLRRLPQKDVGRTGATLSVPGFIRTGLGYQGVAVLGLGLSHGHMFFVMFIGSLSAFGIYSAAFGLSRMIAPIQMSIGSAVFAKNAAQDGEEGIATATRAFRLTFLPLLLAAAVGGVCSTWMVRILLGDSFSAAAIPFAILLIEAVVSGAAFILGQHLQATGRVWSVLMRNTLSTLPLLIGFAVLTGENVVIGVSLLLLVSAVVRLVATMMTYRSQLGSGAMRLVPTAEDLRLVKRIVGGTR